MILLQRGGVQTPASQSDKRIKDRRPGALARYGHLSGRDGALEIIQAILHLLCNDVGLQVAYFCRLTLTAPIGKSRQRPASKVGAKSVSWPERQLLARRDSGTALTRRIIQEIW